MAHSEPSTPTTHDKEKVQSMQWNSVTLEDYNISQALRLIQSAQLDLKLSFDEKKNATLQIAAAKKIIEEASKKLRHEETNLRAILVDIQEKKRPFDDAVKYYSEAKCRAFCSAFHKAFPPELRAMVYEELCPEDRFTIVTNPNLKHMDAFDRDKLLPTPYFKYQADRLPFYFDANSSGEVARELVAHVYATETYIFTSRNLCLMDKFLRTDIYKMGIVPGDMVQNLQIALDSQDLGEPELEETPLPETAVIGALRRISTMNNKSAKVEIHIDSPSKVVSFDKVLFKLKEHPTEDIRQFLLEIGPEVYKLKALGFNMQIQWNLRFVFNLIALHATLPTTLDEFLAQTTPLFSAPDAQGVLHGINLKTGRCDLSVQDMLGPDRELDRRYAEIEDMDSERDEMD